MHGDQPSGQPESLGSEIERFCGNIADAARDRRYVLQAKELEKLQAEIDQRMQALEAKRAEYEVWMTKREAFLALIQTPATLSRIEQMLETGKALRN